MVEAAGPLEAMEPEEDMTDDKRRTRRQSRPRVRPADTPPPVEDPGHDSGQWDDPVSRARNMEEISTTTVLKLRDELDRRDRDDRERKIRRQAIDDAEAAAAASEKAEAEETRKAEEERRKKTRYRLVNGLLAALTTAVTGFGTYFATRPPATHIAEAETAKKEAEVAKDYAVETAKTATETDKKQDAKLQQLGLQAVDQVVLDVDTTDYNARMLKAMSARAAKEEEPDTFKEARKKAETIKKHRKAAAAQGLRYDPFDDLPKPK